MTASPKTLAVDGGAPVRTEPFPRWPRFDSEQIEASAAVLASGRVNYWTGQEGRFFEEEYALHLGVPHAVAVTNGTVALHAALDSLGLGPGDEVVVTSRSFVASASCAVLCGAVPVFADVERDGNMSAATIEAVLSPATRAIVVVHLAGLPCEMDEILGLATRRGLWVVEDCAQAHGARYRGRPVGSMGHVAAFSFCQDKILTTGGEGGLVATRDRGRWARAWSFKDHGKDFDDVFTPPSEPGYRYLHQWAGTNARMTEMQAAIGRVGLRGLDAQRRQREAHALAIREQLGRFEGFVLPPVPEHVTHGWYKLTVDVRPDRLRSGWTRHRIQDAIEAEGVPCRSGYGETYREPMFASVGRWEPRPNAAALAASGLVFRVDPALGDLEVRQTCEAVEAVARSAFR